MAPELADKIHEHTGGNPFFVEELCEALKADGQISVQQGMAGSEPGPGSSGFARFDRSGHPDPNRSARAECPGSLKTGIGHRAGISTAHPGAHAGCALRTLPDLAGFDDQRFDHPNHDAAGSRIHVQACPDPGGCI